MIESLQQQRRTASSTVIIEHDGRWTWRAVRCVYDVSIAPPGDPNRAQTSRDLECFSVVQAETNVQLEAYSTGYILYLSGVVTSC